HGEFNPAYLDEVRTVWVFYLLGLVPYCLTQILVAQHLVLKKTYILLSVAFVMNVGNILLNLYFMRIMGLPGLSFATSLVQAGALALLVLSSGRLNREALYGRI
ncbi:MAG: lipid II flippase MurJ, partial [Candidatus Omnitrophica bacterium]|nr:lipid II flippase MurJ [Candidatus Omnitrophota bacterium]